MLLTFYTIHEQYCQNMNNIVKSNGGDQWLVRGAHCVEEQRSAVMLPILILAFFLAREKEPEGARQIACLIIRSDRGSRVSWLPSPCRWKEAAGCRVSHEVPRPFAITSPGDGAS